MSDSTEVEPSLSEAWEENKLPILALALCFVLSHVMAMFIVPAYEEAEVQAFEDPDDPANSFVYIGIILVFTAFVLWIAKRGLDYILHLLKTKKLAVRYSLILFLLSIKQKL
jgi:presenilin-like A22 family membrane protease